MSQRSLFAGPALRRIRRRAGLTQAAMAAALDISPSYLNLLERGQRPLTAGLIVRLSERFDFDAASLSGDRGGGSLAAMRRRLADPRFADLEIDEDDVAEWLTASPTIAAAFARLFDGEAGEAAAPAAEFDGGESPAVRDVRKEIERWSNHFSDLDHAAEALSEELRLATNDMGTALADRLRGQHQIATRILPLDIMPDRMRRLDLHARQLQLSEMLAPPSRIFQTAVMLVQLELKDQMDALTAAAQLEDRGALRLFRRHLHHYAAAAVIMPYQRFLRACEATGYDLLLLQRRFGASFEQVAHRLTTMQRVGARGVPFCMLRTDRAGQLSKRYAGGSGSPLVEGAHRCARWQLHHAFARPKEVVADRVELEDGSRWVTLARQVSGPGRDAQGDVAQFVVALGVDERFAAALGAARGLPDAARLIGLGCTRCLRSSCLQRAMPPAVSTIRVNDRERGLAPFDFSVNAGDSV